MNSEHSERWARLQALCRARGCDGAVVWSRYGSAPDSYADVYYLANYVGPYALVPDFLPHWAGRSHSAFVLPSEGEPLLIVDTPDYRRDLVTVEDVRFSLDVPGTAASALTDRGLDRGRLLLAGKGTMVATTYERFVELCPNVALVEEDAAVAEMRRVKSPHELDLMREAVEVGNAVVEAMLLSALKPGTTEADAVAAGFAVGVTHEMAPYNAVVASGPHSTNWGYGQLPSWTDRVLERGDLFHVDTFGAVNGYLFDFSRTCVVGGGASTSQRELIEGTAHAIESVIPRIVPGVSGRELAALVTDALASKGLLASGPGEAVESAMAVGFPCYGHGIGLSWEAPWIHPGESTVIEVGMCLAVEAMTTVDGVGGAQYEANLIVHEDCTEILTTVPVLLEPT